MMVYTRLDAYKSGCVKRNGRKAEPNLLEHPVRRPAVQQLIAGGVVSTARRNKLT